MTERTAYAHSLEGRSKSEWETLEAHSLRVAAAARNRADAFGGGALATALGLLHDLGKAKPGFQRKLAGERNDVGHSAEGAAAIVGWDSMAVALAPAIAGHHGGLPNPDVLKRRLNGVVPPALPRWCHLPSFAFPERVLVDRKHSAYRLQFLVRMLYGALCDADDRETAAFYAEADGRDRPAGADKLTPAMADAFAAYIAGLGGDGAVNELRRRILDHARATADESPGAFTLTVPTGGGKTLTSLGFGLAHAARHGLDRLIFVIPYTSIVEQTADVFRAVLGEGAVLEHHANADWAGEDESESEQLKIAGASWEVPVVVTTAVQFFESLHAARKKRCRKLPSLARSVIVIDEAQTMPLALLRPCLAALNELIAGYGATVVLSTATQPALTRAGGFPSPEAIEGAREIAPDPPALYRALRRVEVVDAGRLDDAALTSRIRSVERVLLIVDNRAQARGLFEALRGEEGVFHLSTLMVPAHRRAVLADVCARLEGQGPVRLVATSLVEAGVDIDFPLVLRAAAGIDSIAQAAGRCNREGRLAGPGLVEVFRSEYPAPPAVEQFAEIGRAVLAEGHEDPIGEAAVASYFRRLWDAYGAEALDNRDTGGIRGILEAIRRSGTETPFEDIEAAFRIIDGDERTVIIRDGDWGVPTRHLDAMRFAGPGAVARAVQSHAVNVPWKMWRTLWDGGRISWWEPDHFGEQFALLNDSALYDPEAGLGNHGAGD